MTFWRSWVWMNRIIGVVTAAIFETYIKSILSQLRNPGVCLFCRNLTKIFWVSLFVEFVLVRFSHFNIAIAYSNSNFLWVHLKFRQNKHTPEETLTRSLKQGCACFGKIWLKYFEFHILWSLCFVDFHTLTLQLPIQTPNSVAPKLQAFVSSLASSAKQAHPRIISGPKTFYILQNFLKNIYSATLILQFAVLSLVI